MIQRRAYIRRTKPPARTSRLRPGKVTLAAKRARAKAAGGIDPDSWQHVVEFYRGFCAYCETEPADQQDHVRPLSRGGTHTIGNVVPCCGPCNYRKGTQTWPVPTPHRFMEAA